MTRLRAAWNGLRTGRTYETGLAYGRELGMYTGMDIATDELKKITATRVPAQRNTGSA
jgi:hypothetical protein